MDRLDSRPQVSGMMTAREPYPSDVSDEEWALAVPYLTLLPETAGQRTHLLREAFDGLRYVVRHGIPWRAMPHDLPPWHAVYDQAMRWLRAGCFEMLAHDLRAVLRRAAGRGEEPSAAILDSRTLRSTPESGARAGWDGHKRTRGSRACYGSSIDPPLALSFGTGSEPPCLTFHRSGRLVFLSVVGAVKQDGQVARLGPDQYRAPGPSRTCQPSP